MAVTEITILTSTSGDLDQQLKEVLESSRPIIDEWYAKTFPGSPATASERGAAMFQQVEDHAKVLLTKQWDSVADHWRWIEAEESQAAAISLSSCNVTNGN